MDELIKISELPKATQVKNTDVTVIVQDGVTKQLPTPILEQSLLDKTDNRYVTDDELTSKAVLKTEKGAPNGVATLDSNGNLAQGITTGTSGNVVFQGIGTDLDPLEATLAVDGKVEEGNIQAVSGGEVYDLTKNLFVIKEYIQMNLTDINSYTSTTKSNLTFGSLQQVEEKSIKLTPASGSVYVAYELMYMSDFKKIEFNIVSRIGSDPVICGLTFGDSDTRIGLEYASNGAVYNTIYSQNGRVSEVATSGKATYSNGDSIQFIILNNKIDIYKNNIYQWTKNLEFDENKINIVSYGKPTLIISNYTEDTTVKDFIEAQATPKESIFVNNSAAYNDAILTDAIEKLEWYDLNYKGDNVSFYALGNYASVSGERRTYISFKDFNNVNIYPIGWTDIYTVDESPRKGLEKFLLKRSRNNDNDIVGSIIINWDKVPEGYRNVESTNYRNNSKLNILSDDLTRIRKQLKKPYIDGDYYSFVDFNKVNNDKYVTGTSVPAIVTTLQDLYDKWDEFLQYPFVTKELLTNQVPSANGNVSMWKYTFSMPNNRNTGSSYPIYRPKIVMTLSLHAFEKMPTICMLELMRDMCENYNSNSLYADLLFNFDIVIIPCANPGAWDSLDFAGTRTNYNGVDLNRNFPYYWIEQGAGTSTWGGDSPLSEIESQKISESLLSIPKEERFLFIDFHNFTGSESDAPDRHMMLFFTPQDESAYYFCRNLVTTFTKKAQAENPEMPQDWNFQAGYSSWHYQRSQGGYLDVYAYSLGYFSTTAEVSRFFRWDGSDSYSDKCVNYGVQAIANYIRLAVKNQVDNIL